MAAVKGVSKPSVTAAVKSGRIAAAVVEHEGRRMLDREMALELWERNSKHKLTGPRKVPGHAPRPKPEAPPPTKAELKRRVELLPDDAIPDLQTSRERREHYQAELAKIDATARRGELVPVEHVKKEAFTAGRVVRDALLNIPDRVAHQLAGEVDPASIHQMLSGEIVQALAGLADG